MKNILACFTLYILSILNINALFCIIFRVYFEIKIVIDFEAILKRFAFIIQKK